MCMFLGKLNKHLKDRPNSRTGFYVSLKFTILHLVIQKQCSPFNSDFYDISEIRLNCHFFVDTFL